MRPRFSSAFMRDWTTLALEALLRKRSMKRSSWRRFFSSLRRVFSYTASSVAICSTSFSTVPGMRRSCLRCTTIEWVVTFSRKRRSWVITISSPGQPRRKRSSQRTEVMSR